MALSHALRADVPTSDQAWKLTLSLGRDGENDRNIDAMVFLRRKDRRREQ
jgi:hypothetical protein